MSALRWLGALAGLLLCASAPAGAISLSLVPVGGSFQVGVGETLGIEIQVSGVDEGGVPPLESFNLFVGFDDSLLSISLEDVDFGVSLGGGLPDSIQLEEVNPGEVHVEEFSLLSAAALSALQPSTFTLATLNFTAVAAGSIELAFGPIDASSLVAPGGVSLSDPEAGLLDEPLPISVTVPEASSALLLGLASGLLGLRRRGAG